MSENEGASSPLDALRSLKLNEPIPARHTDELWSATGKTATTQSRSASLQPSNQVMTQQVAAQAPTFYKQDLAKTSLNIYCPEWS